MGKAMKRRASAIDDQIDAFVQDITLLIREQVELTVRRALNERGMGQAHAKARRTRRTAAPELEEATAPEPSAKPVAAGKRRAATKKRRPEQLTLF